MSSGERDALREAIYELEDAAMMHGWKATVTSCQRLRKARQSVEAALSEAEPAPTGDESLGERLARCKRQRLGLVLSAVEVHAVYAEQPAGDAALREHVNPKVANHLREIVAGVRMSPWSTNVLLRLADNLEIALGVIPARPKQVAEQGADNGD